MGRGENLEAELSDRDALAASFERLELKAAQLEEV